MPLQRRVRVVLDVFSSMIIAARTAVEIVLRCQARLDRTYDPARSSVSSRITVWIVVNVLEGGLGTLEVGGARLGKARDVVNALEAVVEASVIRHGY